MHSTLAWTQTAHGCVPSHWRGYCAGRRSAKSTQDVRHQTRLACAHLGSPLAA